LDVPPKTEPVGVDWEVPPKTDPVDVGWAVPPNTDPDVDAVTG